VIDDLQTDARRRNDVSCTITIRLFHQDINLSEQCHDDVKLMRHTLNLEAEEASGCFWLGCG